MSRWGWQSVAREVFQAEELVDYSYQSSVLELFARRLGSSIAQTLGESLGAKAGPAPMR